MASRQEMTQKTKKQTNKKTGRLSDMALLNFQYVLNTLPTATQFEKSGLNHSNVGLQKLTNKKQNTTTVPGVCQVMLEWPQCVCVQGGDALEMVFSLLKEEYLLNSGLMQ